MTPATSERPVLLVVAGEASGDGMAARVVRELGVPSAGMGGRELARAGAELWFDLVRTGSMGVYAPLARLPALGRAYRGLLQRTARHGITAALLVGFSEFNARLGRALRRRGVRVLWYAPPQVWAWRPRRARTLQKSSDRIALLFPFETALWREAGADAHCVGHPAIERRGRDRDELRRALGLAPEQPALALMPGSRAHEVRSLLPAFLDATRRLAEKRRGLDARLLLATSALPRRVANWARAEAEHAGIGVEVGSEALPAFDAAITASGTATLECALAEVPPCIAYRTDRVAAYLARRLLRVEHVGLPNILLARPAFPEFLQGAASAENLQRATAQLLDELPLYRASCREVRSVLTASGSSPTRQVASLLRPWLN